VIEDHDNEEDYYPVPYDDNYDYPDNGSHKYHKLSDIDELDEDEYPHNGPYYPDETYEPPDDDKPQFLSVNSE
jgi:hypothetical protein